MGTASRATQSNVILSFTYVSGEISGSIKRWCYKNSKAIKNVSIVAAIIIGGIIGHFIAPLIIPHVVSNYNITVSLSTTAYQNYFTIFCGILFGVVTYATVNKIEKKCKKKIIIDTYSEYNHDYLVIQRKIISANGDINYYYSEISKKDFYQTRDYVYIPTKPTKKNKSKLNNHTSSLPSQTGVYNCWDEKKNPRTEYPLHR